MSTYLSRLVTFAVFAAGAVLAPTPVRAQPDGPAGPDSITTPSELPASTAVRDDTVRSGPRMAPVGAWTSRVIRPTPAALQSGNRNLGAGSNLALVGVGLAGVVIGSLVDGDGGTVIAIGGGAVALLGLYRYLR